MLKIEIMSFEFISRSVLVESVFLFCFFVVKRRNYRTRVIISRELYIFNLIFHCGLYCRAVIITGNIEAGRQNLRLG